jgi:hypothetical protein
LRQIYGKGKFCLRPQYVKRLTNCGLPRLIRFFSSPRAFFVYIPSKFFIRLIICQHDSNMIFVGNFFVVRHRQNGLECLPAEEILPAFLGLRLPVKGDFNGSARAQPQSLGPYICRSFYHITGFAVKGEAHCIEFRS